MENIINKTRKEQIIYLLETLEPQQRYAEYIAGQLEMDGTSARSILRMLAIQGKLTKRKGHFNKVFYTLIEETKDVV